MTCRTCRFFRRSVARRVGYCGLDRTRAPLTGDETRPCWQASPDLEEMPAGLFEHLEPVARRSAGQETPPAASDADEGRPQGPRMPAFEPAVPGPASIGRLVEAPTVAPSRDLTLRSPADRRRKLGGGPGEGDTTRA
jgi:hypothetical protein